MDVIVVLCLIGQHASVLRRKAQLDEFDAALQFFQFFVQLILVIHGFFNFRHQLVNIDVVVLIAVFRKQVGGGFGGVILSGFFIFHEENDVILVRIESPFAGNAGNRFAACIGAFSGVVSTPFDGFDLIPLLGFHHNIDFPAAVLCRNVGRHFTVSGSMVVQLNGLVGTDNFLECFVNLFFLGFRQAQFVLDVTPYILAQ